MSRRSVKFVDVFYVVLGAVLLAFGVASFTVPNKITTAGLNGVATIIYYALGFPVGATILVGNVVLMSLQTYIIGTRSAWKTLLSIFVTSLSIEVFMIFPPLTTDPILACLYGGIISGIGVGLTFKVGGTTGGADIITQILNYKYHLPVGDVMLGTNVIISTVAGIVFGPELALYGLLTVFMSVKVVDSVLEGMSVYRTVMILSKHADEIGWAIIEDLRRGVTCLSGYGVYSGQQTNVLLTAVRRGEVPLLRQIIHEYDPDAFVIIGDARQVMGKGFVNLDDQVRHEKDL